MALNEQDPYKERLIQNCISIITTDGILEEAYAQSEEVRKIVEQVMNGHKPELKNGKTVSAEESPARSHIAQQQNRDNNWTI